MWHDVTLGFGLLYTLVCFKKIKSQAFTIPQDKFFASCLSSALQDKQINHHSSWKNRTAGHDWKSWLHHTEKQLPLSSMAVYHHQSQPWELARKHHTWVIRAPCPSLPNREGGPSHCGGGLWLEEQVQDLYPLSFGIVLHAPTNIPRRRTFGKFPPLLETYMLATKFPSCKSLEEAPALRAPMPSKGWRSSWQRLDIFLGGHKRMGNMHILGQ